jgi:hypothetical protein
VKVEQRVEVIASWSSFRGMRGTVTQTSPFLMVVMDDDPRPIRIEEASVVPVEDPQHIAGAE